VRPWSERRASVYIILGWVVTFVVVIGLVLLFVWVTDNNFFIENK
jgi:hypothetical protein